MQRYNRILKKTYTPYFDDEHRFLISRDVEAALLEALERVGIMPHGSVTPDVHSVIRSVTYERVCEIEDTETHHDIMALARGISETLQKSHPEVAAFVHYGATSQDINDTQLAFALAAFTQKQLLPLIDSLKVAFVQRAVENLSTLTVARTHGQHALPTTVGFKLANYLFELAEASGPLYYWKPMMKFSGAVGTHAMLGEHVGPKVEQHVRDIMCEKYGVDRHHVRIADISTQVVTRVNHLQFAGTVLCVAKVIERFARELMALQRTEIDEWREPATAGQVGSSTMPQKRNPYRCERLCSLASVVQGQAVILSNGVVLHHERDLTHSASERIAFETLWTVLTFMLHEAVDIVAHFEVDTAECAENVGMTGAALMSERLMKLLVDRRGLNRQEAHACVKQFAKSNDGGAKTVDEVYAFVNNSQQATAAEVTREEVASILDPRTYTGAATANAVRLINVVARDIMAMNRSRWSFEAFAELGNSYVTLQGNGGYTTNPAYFKCPVALPSPPHENRLRILG